jgi:plastocyanin
MLIALALAPPAAAEVKTFTGYSERVLLGGYQTVRNSEIAPDPELEGFITRMDAHVVDENGAVVPQDQIMLHHLVFVNRGRFQGDRRDGACPHRGVGEKFYGTSEELRAMDLPAGHGYPIRAREAWKMIWMLMNHRPGARNVRIRYRVTIDTAPDLTPVKPYWVSVVPCTPDPQYTVPGGGPPGSTHTRSVDWNVPVTGRIVALGGHLHGGARNLALDQPRCDRNLFTSQPTYGPPNDPIYRVRPTLHEPDPRNITWFKSATGLPVVAGEALRLHSNYDGQWPRMRVMGIMHVYVAEDPAAAHDCPPPPDDIAILGPEFGGGRTDPPHSEVRLAERRPGGVARPISRPDGRRVIASGNTDVQVRRRSFRPANLEIPLGATVRYRFPDSLYHDATLASGPLGFASPYSKNGMTFKQRFTAPGKYRIHCSVHPVTMSQLIRVRP